jgi:hypothetical protein
MRLLVFVQLLREKFGGNWFEIGILSADKSTQIDPLVPNTFILDLLDILHQTRHTFFPNVAIPQESLHIELTDFIYIWLEVATGFGSSCQVRQHKFLIDELKFVKFLLDEQ